MHINSFTEWDELKSIMIGHMNTEGDFTNFKGYTNPNQKHDNVIKGPIVKKIANGVKNAIERRMCIIPLLASFQNLLVFPLLCSFQPIAFFLL